ncbi:TPA: hypothetical protein DCZ46_00265 [Candidatus Campbellbacteria bacterium]|nr:hypothetical protein [Candidatus Campbellbacteria bacterium]HAQ02065.1 hypothetical protein [Candidatus Campbellbacteria bacterium]HBC70389.1 hypothetical protein [Candidatus Campbellbacteria bacterium]
MAKMTEERRNQIAYLLVLNQARSKGIGSLMPNVVARQIGTTAAELRISPDEAREFATDMANKLVAEAFPPINE